MPVASASDTIVELCRAATPDDLQTLIGSTTRYWATQGFSVVRVEYFTHGQGFAGIYVRKIPGGPPSNKFGEMIDDYSAVVVMSG